MIDDTAANMRAAEARAGRVRPARINGMDPRVREVTERIGHGYQPNPPSGRERMTADMQAELAGRRPSDADINDDFARRLGSAGKTRPARPAAVRGRGQVSLAWDDDPKAYGWHYSPAENAEGIRSRGFDPELAGRHGPNAKGVHFATSPETYQPIGDQDWNVYRVRRENIPDPSHVSTDDFFTRSPIDPRNIEVYEGPGKFGKLADAGSTTLGIMALLGQAAQFVPGFSDRMPRTTWLANGGPLGDVLNEVMAANYAPGGVMDPYRDMRDLPGFNPATGTVPA